MLVLGVMEISGDSVMERLSIHEHFSQVSQESGLEEKDALRSLLFLLLRGEDDDVIDDERE